MVDLTSAEPDELQKRAQSLNAELTAVQDELLRRARGGKVVDRHADRSVAAQRVLKMSNRTMFIIAFGVMLFIQVVSRLEWFGAAQRTADQTQSAVEQAQEAMKHNAE